MSDKFFRSLSAMMHHIKKWKKHFTYVTWTSLFCLALIFAVLPSDAIEVENVPNPRQINGSWVTDRAGILSSSAEFKLNQMLSKLDAQNGTEMAIVTVPDTHPYPSPKAFTTKLFNYWGIGKRNKNNGVLLMVSKGDRRVEIETGRGMQKILPNATVNEIIQAEIIPRFQQNNFEGGIIMGTRAIIDHVIAKDKLLPSPGSKRHFLSLIPTYIWAIGILGITWTAITFIWLLWNAKRPLTLAPNANLRRSPRDDELYQAFSKVKTQPLEEAYHIKSG